MHVVTHDEPDCWADPLEEALKLLRAPDNMRERAQTWLVAVADEFNYRLNRESKLRNSPIRRVAHLKTELSELAVEARDLARRMELVWPWVHHAASPKGFSENPYYSYTLPEVWIDDDGTPNFAELLSHKPAQLKALLPEIAYLMDWLSEQLSDSGGEPDLLAMFYVTPKRGLSVECWELFWFFRPGEATQSESRKDGKGDYYHFTAMVYELATGQSAEDPGVGMIRYVKEAVTLCDDLLSRVPGLRDRCDLLAPEESPVGFISKSSLAGYVLHPRPKEKNEEACLKEQRAAQEK